MKFGKELAAQMVQEWHDAYMDYNSLKAVLKDIMRIKQRSISTTMAASTSKSSLKRKVSLYRAFSGLTSRHRSSPRKNEDEVILVHAVEQPEAAADGHYQTMFLMSSDTGGETEVVFFRRLDDEFNKVLNFYKMKVHEVMDEANELTKQMDALIALRINVDKPIHEADLENLATNHERKPGRQHMDVIQEVEMEEQNQNGIVENSGDNYRKGKGQKVSIQGSRPTSLEVLDHVHMNITPETPVSTLKGILMSTNSATSFGKKELRKAEERMTQAFTEFYRKLQILKSYCFLNLLAFSKIMKKYDKITSRNASKTYMAMVDKSYLGSSDEITRLIERVEATFIKHFANGNHRKGMKILRPKARRERHRITFSLGFFSGCSLALVIATVVLIHARDLLKSAEGRGKYMENMFPLYSLFGFIVLHMLMYSANIYFWRRYRVNYSFIFGFKRGTELGYRQVFLLSSVLAVLALVGVISNLDMEMDERTRSFGALTELVPLGLLTVMVLIIFCPFNIIYRSSRFILIQSMFHCLCAPLYKVTLQDFFLADQLTSQVQAFRSFEFYVCYYGWGDFKIRANKCHESDVYKSFYFIVALVPYWMRFLQSLRRWIEEKDAMQGYNGLKYLSIIVAVAMRTTSDLHKGILIWKIMAAVSSGVATIIATYWDIVIDWGLLRRDSKNPWLRDKLLVSNTSVYFVAMALNVVLRLAWMQSVLGFREAPFLHRQALIAIVACLEIIRRGIWNFFRLENEHLNNVGKYRAFKSVPLPFNYDNDEDRDT